MFTNWGKAREQGSGPGAAGPERHSPEEQPAVPTDPETRPGHIWESATLRHVADKHVDKT